jgi:hypothetical protein
MIKKLGKVFSLMVLLAVVFACAAVEKKSSTVSTAAKRSRHAEKGTLGRTISDY